MEQEKTFTDLLQTILDHTSDTLPLLAEGFRESKRYIKVECRLSPVRCTSIAFFQQEQLVKNFLDRALTSRLAIRMLIEHHRALREDRVCSSRSRYAQPPPSPLLFISAQLHWSNLHEFLTK